MLYDILRKTVSFKHTVWIFSDYEWFFALKQAIVIIYFFTYCNTSNGQFVIYFC